MGHALGAKKLATLIECEDRIAPVKTTPYWPLSLHGSDQLVLSPGWHVARTMLRSFVAVFERARQAVCSR